jgi:predicted nucleotidyltransferase
MGRRVADYEERFEEFIEVLYRSGLAGEVYLAGSRARIDNIPSSDFDILLIVSDDKDPIKIATRTKLLRKKDFPARSDLLPALKGRDFQL